MMNIRKSLIKLAQRVESAWQHVNMEAGPVEIEPGWYVTEFVLDGTLMSTPRIIVDQSTSEKADETVERLLIGAHSGRNRMLIYLPRGRLCAYSQSISFQLLARIPGWEGRSRVLLICWRYLLNFFSPRTIVRMITMQFKAPFMLSTDVLEFYSPPETTVYATLEWWQRRTWWAACVSWYLRDISIGVVVAEDEQQAQLKDLICPPDVILIASDQPLPTTVNYWIPLGRNEQLRSPAILLFKLAVWRANRAVNGALLLYCDHDYAANGSCPQTPEPVFKPNASLPYLYCYNYLGPAVMFHGSVVQDVAAAELLDESWQYRTALDVMSHPSQVSHLPELLVTSTRVESLKTPEPNRINSAWANIDWQRDGEHNRLVATTSWVSEPSVDIVIPTRDGLQFLSPCVDGLLNNTDYQNCHLYIVDNGSELADTKSWLRDIELNSRVTVLEYPGEFNFSAINNTAVAQGRGDYIALVNNDIEVIHADWLKQMMVWAEQPNVGVVGAKLLFGNGLVQHAGVTVGMGNAAGHIHRLEAGDSPGYQNRCIATQNMMAVTAACFITPRALFESLGGLNESDFKVAYNDIDYCLRVEKRGLEVIWTPEACLYHHESVSRGDDMSEQHIERYFKELAALQKRWKTRGFVDKYYNKHLRISDEGVYPQVDVTGHDSLHEM